MVPKGGTVSGFLPPSTHLSANICGLKVRVELFCFFGELILNLNKLGFNDLIPDLGDVLHWNKHHSQHVGDKLLKGLRLVVLNNASLLLELLPDALAEVEVAVVDLDEITKDLAEGVIYGNLQIMWKD